MNQIAHSLVVASEVTLADVAAALSSVPDLSEVKKANLLSSLNTIGRILNRHIADLPADIMTLRALLETVHHVQAGISPKRLGNVKSDLKTALKMTAPCFAAPQSEKLSPAIRTDEWKNFLAGLETKWQRYTLARLATFCSEFDYTPDQMCDVVLERYGAYLSETEACKDPAGICKRAAQTWNGAVTRLKLPLPLLTIPKKDRYQAIPLSQFPASFQAEAQTYLDRLAKFDPIATDGPPKPLAPQSVTNVRRIICQFATGIVLRGRPLESMTSLKVLVEIEHFKEGIRFFLARNGGQPPYWLWDVLGKILAIGKYFVKLSDERLAELQHLRRKVKVKTEGLTERNRARLDQFYDIRNFDLLQSLPAILMRRAEAISREFAKADRTSSRAALLAMHAVAIDILLAAPLRAKNLATIDIATNFIWHGQGNSQSLTLFIPGSSVKNKVTFEGPIPRDTARRIKIYLKSYRHLICAAPGDWLFPWPSGGHRSPDHVAQGLCKVIWRETGLVMNAHLFRHLAGLMWLRHHPGDYETVRRMLGHTKLDTTINFYTGLNSKWAIARYQDEILSRKGRLK